PPRAGRIAVGSQGALRPPPRAHLRRRHERERGRRAVSERVALRGLMAIAAREVSERVALLGLAVVVAGVPFIGPWIGIGDRPLLGVLLGVVMVFAAAVLTGSSVIASDLAEGRLGFFFSPPGAGGAMLGRQMVVAVA